MYNGLFICSLILITQIAEATVYRYLTRKYKVYRGEVVPGVFDGWLDDLDVPSRMTAPASPRELHSFKGDDVGEQTLGRRS